MSTTDDNNDQYVGGSEGITSNKEECISCEQNNVDHITKDFNGMAILDSTSACANCGKVGNSNDMNVCNKCKSVRYCNAACKKKHRTKHKKACDRRMAELVEYVLFEDVEPDECPICMLQIPVNAGLSTFKSCCGKVICNGCGIAMKLSEGKDLCAFCRKPPALSREEDIKQTKSLIENGNAEACHYLAGLYANGRRGLPQDYRKANELWLKAGKLGCADGYCSMGHSFSDGTGVERDLNKALYYYQLAAMMGNINARHNLACIEGYAGNERRAMKHYMMAARAGMKESLDRVKNGFMKGLVTKDEYANTLRAYQKRQDEMKSDDRDKAATAFEALSRFADIM